MLSKVLLLLASAAVIASGTSTSRGGPRDMFRMIISNVDENRVQKEVQDFTQYGCEKMVVIRNQAKEDVTLSCASYEDNAPRRPVTIKPGKAFFFTFRPRKDGLTQYWCNIEYKYQFARFDAYNEALPYMEPRTIHEAYQYVINHDGLLVDNGREGGEGTKIRSLFKGHNKFMLWEEYDNNQTNGLLYSGLVDGGMCSDVPDQFNDKGKAVTICYNHCVHIYEHYGCRGKVQTAQAGDDCMDVPVGEQLVRKLSSVKGC